MSPTVLVIESNFDLAEAIQSVLIAHDIDCITGTHNPEALTLLNETNISLVICELDTLAANCDFRIYFSCFLLFHSATVLYTTCSYVPEDVHPNQILQKPFSVESLVEMVKSQIAGSFTKRIPGDAPSSKKINKVSGQPNNIATASPINECHDLDTKQIFIPPI